MEKRVWTRPAAVCEQFDVNEYIAACWDIYCNVPWGSGYVESNGVAGLQTGRGGDDFRGTGSGCGTTHQANGIDAAGPSANAYWVTADGTVLNVFHFQARGEGSNSNHFCTLDAVNWDENPNASN